MVRNLPIALARRVYRVIPPRFQQTAKNLSSGWFYPLNTRGLGANAEMVAWSAVHRRPVSIVIPSYNDLPLLTECLKSIEETCGGFDYEVIIVDDYCQPENAAELKKLENDRITVVLKDERLGFAGTVNVGMRLARHDIVLLNSDIVAKAGWLEALQYSAYEIDENIGMVSPKLVYPDGRIQYGGTYYARVLAPQWFGHLHVGAPATKPSANVPGYNRSVSGACVYITRSAFERVGVLDDEYWLGFEDVDYGLQAWRHGVRCYYQPAAMLVHHESASRGYSQGWRELASMRKFWRQWADSFLTRTVAQPVDVDVVVSDATDGLWRHYVEQQVEALRASGHAAVIHELHSDSAPDEDVIARLQQRDSIAVAADWKAGVTVWLSTVDAGKPAYLLPTVESIFHPTDPGLQARIISQYRPEFEYVAPNRWTQRQLQAETAWEVPHRVVPALRPAPLPAASPAGVVVTIGADATVRSTVDRLAAEVGATVEHRAEAPDSAEALAELRLVGARAIVSLGEPVNSLVPIALMSLGAAYIGRQDERTGYEVLDGYNALLLPADGSGLEDALRSVLTIDAVHVELRENGHATAVHYAELSGRSLSRAFASIADTSV
ncbi:glycosyltransferase family 2 protein [Leifsonia sp. YIM 134122]|uniref:Glycosyltransferase family 2 protein n=1 Tax=Leifsonia stereocauli TaxID=3134136 RepID=A0ABU9W3X8_9MICO